MHVFCSQPWSRDSSRAQWVKCMMCSNWTHVECSGMGKYNYPPATPKLRRISSKREQIFFQTNSKAVLTSHGDHLSFASAAATWEVTPRTQYTSDFRPTTKHPRRGVLKPVTHGSLSCTRSKYASLTQANKDSPHLDLETGGCIWLVWITTRDTPKAASSSLPDVPTWKLLPTSLAAVVERPPTLASRRPISFPCFELANWPPSSFSGGCLVVLQSLDAIPGVTSSVGHSYARLYCIMYRYADVNCALVVCYRRGRRRLDQRSLGAVKRRIKQKKKEFYVLGPSGVQKRSASTEALKAGAEEKCGTTEWNVRGRNQARTCLLTRKDKKKKYYTATYTECNTATSCDYCHKRAFEMATPRNRNHCPIRGLSLTHHMVYQQQYGNVPGKHITWSIGSNMGTYLENTSHGLPAAIWERAWKIKYPKADVKYEELRRSAQQASCEFHLGWRHMEKDTCHCSALPSYRCGITRHGLIPWLVEGILAYRSLGNASPYCGNWLS
ncbi:hypothetical protein PR048_008024 [Dryococelus australis]|uniref:Uncharacterized protein n=1 Tax=Dryococelus australis TaxID=614101 RepID=A0ABQ9HXK4_9NEOP|nr:hypothetical protein PR048_008024 [Dryococelus australis]